MGHLLVTFLVLTGFSTFGQSRQLFLQIDTVEFVDRFKAIGNFKVRVDNQGLFGSNEVLNSTENLQINKHPNFTRSVSLEADSNSISIPIDNQGSYLKLYNAYSLVSDTIRISRLPQFKCTFPDTTFSTIVYWKKVNGELIKPPYRVKKTVRQKKERGTKVSSRKQSVIINDISYEIGPTLDTAQEVINHGHGHKPRHYRDNQGNEKKRLTYIFYDRLIHQYRLTAEIKLKKRKHNTNHQNRGWK
jgi:hypothetical protein